MIIFYRSCCFGGYGDCVVGLMNSFIISRILKRSFYIEWETDNIRPYLNYSKYDITSLSINKRDVVEYIWINDEGCDRMAELVCNNDNVFDNKVTKIVTNMEIGHILYKKLNIPYKQYITDMLQLYQRLYTDILIPTPYTMSIINKLIKNKKNIVGVQLRLADGYMSNHPSMEPLRSRPNLTSEFKKIKQHCEEEYTEYYIFITSDYNDIMDIAIKFFDKKQIIYNNVDVIHSNHLNPTIERESIAKTYVDNYILHKCDKLYISGGRLYSSNYGKIAALACSHSNIYDTNCTKIEKHTLLNNKYNVGVLEGWRS